MPARAVTKTARAGRQNRARKARGALSTRAPSSLKKAGSHRLTQAERREKAEQAILLAALDIIAEKGIEELTLAEAGERAGYSRALPAHYFASKDDALVALGNFVVGKYLRRVQPAVQGREGLEGFLDRVCHYFDDGPKDPRIVRAFHAVLGAAPCKPALAKAISQLAEDSKATFCEFFSVGIARGEIRKDVVPEVEAIWILACLRGVMSQWLIGPERTPLPKVRDAFIVSMRKALEA